MPSERELQHALGVGRSTIREAMTGLAVLGVVEIRHGEGTFVAADPERVGATGGITAALAKGVTPGLLEARRPVESEIARLAALRRTDEDLRALEGVLATHERALAEDTPAARVSAQFHVVLADAAHNDVLAGFVASYRELLVTRGPSLEEVDGYRAWELAEHRGLYEVGHLAGDAFPGDRPHARPPRPRDRLLRRDRMAARGCRSLVSRLESGLWPRLRHYWHPVAQAIAVLDRPVPVTLLGTRLVLARLDGRIACFRDLCIHRGTPLSLGSGRGR